MRGDEKAVTQTAERGVMLPDCLVLRDEEIGIIEAFVNEYVQIILNTINKDELKEV